jgi:hypothetical protein
MTGPADGHYWQHFFSLQSQQVPAGDSKPFNTSTTEVRGRDPETRGVPGADQQVFSLPGLSAFPLFEKRNK